MHRLSPAWRPHPRRRKTIWTSFAFHPFDPPPGSTVADRGGRWRSSCRADEARDRRCPGHQDREPLLRLPDRGNRLHRHIGGGRKRERARHQPGIDRARAQCSNSGPRRQTPSTRSWGTRRTPAASMTARELPFWSPTRRRLRTAQHAEHQRGSRRPDHSAATPLCWRSAISLRVRGMSSRPYSMASISGSKPRMRKWLMPRSW